MESGAKRTALELIDQIIRLKEGPNVHKLSFELQPYLRELGFDPVEAEAMLDELEFGDTDDAKDTRMKVVLNDAQPRR